MEMDDVATMLQFQVRSSSGFQMNAHKLNVQLSSFTFSHCPDSSKSRLEISRDGQAAGGKFSGLYTVVQMDILTERNLGTPWIPNSLNPKLCESRETHES
jgi:hypothetical protein